MSDENTNTNTEGGAAEDAGATSTQDLGDALYGNDAKQGSDDASASEPNDTEQGDATEGDDASQDDERQQDDAEKGAEEGEQEEAAEGEIEYEDFTVPAGFEADQVAIDQFTPVAKEIGLTQEQAQACIDVYASAMERQLEALANPFKELSAAREETFKNDPEIGGENKEQAVSDARRFLDAYASPELMEELTSTRFGDSAELTRMLARAAKDLKPDGIPAQGGGGAAEVSFADALYPES